MILFRKGLLGGPPLPLGCLFLAGLLLLAGLGCGVAGMAGTLASLSGPAYWAAETSTPRPTATVFLGTTTPVYPPTPVPGQQTTTPEWVTTTPEWTTVTPIYYTTPIPYWVTTTPEWVTTTPFAITETPEPPVTTTPALPLIGFTTPEPLETPYYRVGSFYMQSDVYVGGPHGLVFRVTAHETQNSPQNERATYHYVTVRVRNYTDDEVLVPMSDLFFIREVHPGAETLTGRWVPQNEPLIARSLPLYESQQAAPLPAGVEREYVLGFVVPDGEVRALGLITNWTLPLEGGLPVWFLLELDPLGPLVDAVHPPPPTPILFDEGGTFGGNPVGTPGAGGARWPTTGTITRGFGCEPYYTGIDGAGWGCPEERPWFHNGVDIANSTGTAIVAPTDGTITYAGPDSTGADCSHIAGSVAPHEGLGNYQRLAGADTVHYFGHLSAFTVTGGNVTTGDPISQMGSTGCSTGSHLHWIVYQSGNLVDPAVWAGPGP